MTPLSGQALVDAAYATARIAHAGQFRADGVTPYITHPFAVEQELLANWGNVRLTWSFANEEEEKLAQARGRAIALLHDTVEDAHGFSFDRLRAEGFGDIVPDLILLTRREEQSYLDYVLTIRGMRNLNPLAYYVKLADLAANMATVHMVPDKRRAKTMLTKWQMAQWILRS